MYARILLPLDLTDHNGSALKRASEIARASNAQLWLLHVVETVAGVEIESDEEFYRRFFENSQEKLSAAAAQLRSQGLAVEFTTTYGSRGDKILEHTLENDIDLMIVRSPALSPEEPRKGLASLSWKLGLLARCDVLLVK